MRLQGPFCLGLLVVCATAFADPPPVEQFTNHPRLDALTISPSGKYLAATHHDGDRHVLTISEFPSTKTVKVLNYGDRLDVTDLRWIDDRYLVIQPARLLPEQGAGKFLTGEIYRVDVKAGTSTMIYSIFSNNQGNTSRARQRSDAQVPAEILSLHSGNPREILIQTVAYAKLPGAVYRLDVQGGRMVGAGASPVIGARFVTGANHRIALAYGTDDQGRSVLYYLPNRTGAGNSDWVLKSTTQREEGALIPVAWAGKGEEYYALDTRDASTTGVVIWDANSNTQRLLFRNSSADLVVVSKDESNERPWMFAGFDHYPTYWYPDPQHPLAVMHRKLVQTLPRQWIEVTGQTADMSKAVVKVGSGERPPVFLVVDVASGRPLLRMDTYPELKAPEMAAVEAVEFKARDGLPIRGYLTSPRDADGKPRRNLPMIVMVHGGPYGIFDSYGYEYPRQLFASRGYAVLQVNFRGSGGRGRDYQMAGFGQWARKMQDDVTDGVRWSIQNGVADARRICIYGGSYGAFTALVGVAREPEMFKCAVGYAGVYDLTLMFKRGDIRMVARGVNYLKDAIGDDERELEARSPVNMAKDIKARVLLIHGVDDFRAPLAHATRMREVLTEAGNPPEWIVESGEAHGFNDPANRAAAYRAMLEFFAKNLGN